MKLFITPAYISGLTQADGSFFISIEVSNKHRNGLRIRPKFSITQDLGSVETLETIKNYFNCGKVYTNPKKHSAEFVVESVKDLKATIIPHFIEYPLQLDKQRAFSILMNVVDTLDAKAHYDKLVCADMLKLILSMNVSSNRSDELKNKYFDILGVPNDGIPPILPDIIDHPLTEPFLIGLIDGDGCFSVSFGANRKLSLGFHITGHISVKPLFDKVQSLLNCGQVRDKSATEVRYQIDNFTDMRDILIPLVDQYDLHSTKSVHYEIFKKVLYLIDVNAHMTPEGFMEIIDLAYNMNLEGKRRKLTKQEYVDLYVSNWK